MQRYFTILFFLFFDILFSRQVLIFVTCHPWKEKNFDILFNIILQQFKILEREFHAHDNFQNILFPPTHIFLLIIYYLHLLINFLYLLSPGQSIPVLMWQV